MIPLPAFCVAAKIEARLVAQVKRLPRKRSNEWNGSAVVGPATFRKESLWRRMTTLSTNSITLGKIEGVRSRGTAAKSGRFRNAYCPYITGCQRLSRRRRGLTMESARAGTHRGIDCGRLSCRASHERFRIRSGHRHPYCVSDLKPGDLSLCSGSRLRPRFPSLTGQRNQRRTMPRSPAGCRR